MSESEVLEHVPCIECDSSDALALYSDGHGFCFSCNKHFSASMIHHGKEEEEPYVHKETEPTGTNLITEGDYQPLTSRQLKVETLRKYDYLLSKWRGNGVQIANYRDKTGQKVAQHLRFANKEFMWNGDAKKVQLFGQHLFKEGGKRLVITEGEIDCMTLAQEMGLTWATVSLPSGAAGAKKAILRELEYCESFDDVVLAFDDDEAGQKAVADVAPLFTPGKARVMKYSGYKDANELFLEKGRKSLVGELFNASTYRPDGIINAKTLWDEVRQPIETGLVLPYPTLSDMLYGHRQGEITMLTAGSGLGKSTLAHEMGYHLMTQYGMRLGVLALEEPVRKATERYMSIDMNKPLHLTREGITDAELEESFKRVTNNDNLWLYDHFGSTDVDNLLSKVRYMVIGLGIQTIVLDHISIVVSGLDEGLGTSERKMIDILMTKLRSLVNETNCSIIAVVHLKRVGDKGKSWNEGKAVSLTALRGSAALEQLSDNVVSIERNQQSETDSNVAQLRVLKCRHSGITGKADQLIYNIETGRLTTYCPFDVDAGEYGEGENSSITKGINEENQAF